jgi:hypothetical protein
VAALRAEAKALKAQARAEAAAEGAGGFLRLDDQYSRVS